MTEEQRKLFELPRSWEDHWGGMPAFRQDDMRPWQSITFHFRNKEDRDRCAEKLDLKFTTETQSTWYPKAEIINRALYSSQKVEPRYPIYIISKGRWESRLTVKAFEMMHVPYSIVIESQELAQYAEVIDPKKIIVMPSEKSNLGQGSITARNFVWDHAESIGAERHWVVDDNISGFIRQHENRRLVVDSGATIRAMEDFTDRYENIALSGPNYRFFAPTRDPRVPPFYLNTRVYSCILIKTSLNYRWRGRYNEDTDLSLRVLKDGHCTVLFNAFKINKMATMTMKGGNTDELYKDDGRKKMAESLKEQHPDVVSITRKWNRWQHHVDYRPFKKNRLVLRSDVGALALDYPNEFGMTLREINDDSSAIYTETLEETQDEGASEIDVSPIETSDDASTTSVALANDEFKLTP
jgi:hypothetical protein